MVAGLLLGGSLVLYGAPELYIAEDVFDFGVAVAGDVVSFAFVLENRGDEVLTIESVRTSCGCTTTALSSSKIDPGRSVRLGGQLSTSGYGGSTVSKSVYLSTDDPTRPNVTLEVTGRVVKEAAYLVQAADLAGSFMLLVDLRDPASYAAGHLPSAINLAESTADVWLEILPQDVRIVLVDQTGEGSERLAERMLPLGFARVEVLAGGMDEWARLYGNRMLITLPLVIGPLASE
jgi:thiosulfate sulfurtransferase